MLSKVLDVIHNPLIHKLCFWDLIDSSVQVYKGKQNLFVYIFLHKKA